MKLFNFGLREIVIIIHATTGKFPSTDFIAFDTRPCLSIHTIVYTIDLYIAYYMAKYINPYSAGYSMLKFTSRISSMGDNKIIWIPKALHRMTEGLEDREITVLLETEKEGSAK